MDITYEHQIWQEYLDYCQENKINPDLSEYDAWKSENGYSE